MCTHNNCFRNKVFIKNSFFNLICRIAVSYYLKQKNQIKSVSQPLENKKLFRLNV